MIYMKSFFYILSFIFACLSVSTFLSMYKVKMYPPKKVLKQQATIYIGGALLSIFIAWIVGYF
ncbi:hypothetical protein [Thermaerobacillus caldiproteolyticus]|uniref:Membrane-associated HD superfamily phosphohydrolase n=1 Tax=Thermaerobacillus caldiproteolyticus TaxID=247480 RepID=A0A7V9Z667_9BACL|nr:hypothetical protein [Anoxybacillus caldiproteolyticus]MBA2874799.1 membrane-associated HD superfamily phosphohydrolase [Anoxybacillus caldiproteolyticus]